MDGNPIFPTMIQFSEHKAQESEGRNEQTQGSKLFAYTKIRTGSIYDWCAKESEEIESSFSFP